MSRTAYEGRHRAHEGRHRPAQRTRTGLPRATATGFLLPTAAVATIVLTTTGAHLGTAEAAGTASTSSVSAGANIASLADGASADALLDARLSQSARASRSSRGTASSSGTATSQDDATATDAVPAGVSTDLVDEAKAESRSTGQELAKIQGDAVAQQAAAKQAAAAKAAADAKAAAAAAAAAKAKQWVAPINVGYHLTSGFGMRWGAMHPGQDFAIPVGTPVKSLSNGTVVFAGWSGGYGNKVEIQYWDGTVSWYAHNSKLLVKTGDTVTTGETVSLSGDTGHSTGPHLHVEIHVGGVTAIPPIPWLSAKGIMP